MITQRLANRYPLWSTLRSDPSSNGFRFLDSFREGFENTILKLKKTLDEGNLLKMDLGIGTIYALDLEEQLPVTVSSGGLQKFVAPTVTGDSILLAEAEYEEDFFYPTVDRISLLAESDFATNTLVLPIQLSSPNKIAIEVVGSSEYFDRTNTENRFYRNRYFVRLEGIDLNYNSVKETIDIMDDGVWFSNHIYRELTSMVQEGFDGTVTLKQYQTDLLYKRHPYKTVVFTDFEGPSHLSLSTESLYSETVSFLRVFTPQIKRGSQYRDGGDTEENDYTFCDIVLRDDEGNNLELVDFAVSPRKGEIYAITSTGLYIYDLDIGFLKPQTEKTRTNSILVVPAYPYPKYGTEESILTWFRNPVEPIANVQIKRILPNLTVEYLQANETWAAGVYTFPGQEAKLVPDTWADKKFATEYNQVGQWEYILTSVDRNALEEISVSSTLVPYLDAKKVIDTSLITEPLDGIFFNADGILCLRADKIYQCNEHFDIFLIDQTGEVIYTRENYEVISAV